MMRPANQANQFDILVRPAHSSWVVPNRSPTPWTSILAHKRLAISLLVVVSIVGLAVALLMQREFVTEATIRVSPAVPASMYPGEPRFSSNLDYRDFVQQQVFEIDDYATVSAALNSLGSKRWSWQRSGESDRHAAERLMWNLKVASVPDSYLITIDLSGAKPEGLAEIVNGVAQSYLARAAKRELNGTDVGFQLLTSRQKEIEDSIAKDQAQLAGLAQELGVPNVDSALVNPYEKMIEDSNAALAEARRAVLVAQAHLNAVKSNRERIKDSDVEAKARQQAASGSETSTAKQQLVQQREQALVQLSGLGPNHPGRKALEAQIEITNRELAKLDQAALDRARSEFNDVEQATTSVKISDATSNLEQAQSAAKGIEQELEKVKATAANFGTKFGQAVAVQEKLKQARADLRDLQERMSMLRLKSEAPGLVALEAAAMVPDSPERSKRRVIFGLFLLFALAASIGGPTLVDLIDQKIKTASELEAILGFPALGVAPSSVGSLAQEARRRIALGIMREWRRSEIRSFVLTSIRQGANISLALALAEELNALGVRALVIEASLIRSGCENLKTTATGSGVIAVPARATRRLVPLSGTGTLELRGQSTAPGGNGSLQRVQSAPSDAVARNFGYVRETVNRSLDSHDIVFLVAPPLLSSADAIALFEMPAGAILVTRAGKDQVSDIAAAIRELERCAPPVVGAIICADEHHLTGFDPLLEEEFVDSPAPRAVHGMVRK